MNRMGEVQDMEHIQSRGEVRTGLWGNWRDGGHLDDLGVDGKIILNWILEREWEGAWTRLNWLRTGQFGRLF
jgi:hypothetical protein